MLYLLFISQLKLFNQLYITNNMEHFSFKSGHSVHVAKLTKTDWLVCSLVARKLDKRAVLSILVTL